MTTAIFASLRRFGVILGFAVLAFSAGAPAASAGSEHTLVLARPGAAQALRRAGAVRIARALPIWSLRRRSATRVVPELMRAGLVTSSQPDRPLPPESWLGASDPLLPGEWWIPVIRADAATPPGPGKPVTVIDTGADLSHEEFASRPDTRALNTQFVTGADEEHGTAVSSVVGAPVNGVGLVGVYPQAKLQVWDSSPTGNGISSADLIAGLDAAVTNGPGVINLSLGSTVNDPLIEDMIAVAQGTGSLVVAAAGNDRTQGSPLEYPASLPHVLTAGALDTYGQPAYFSSGSPFVDLAAPGYSIPVAVPTAFEPSGYDSYSGTSFASPLVAGTAAWVWTARPTLDPSQLFEIMRGSAQDISTHGFDPFTGFGRLDVPTALAAPAPLADPQEPNEDVLEIKAHGLFREAARPLTAAGRTAGSLLARLDFAEDPRDVYRFWVPGKRTAVVAVMPIGGDVDLALWGQRTSSVLEGGAARRRDLRGLSERLGTRRDALRLRNTGKRGAYFYAEASVGYSGGTVVRRVAGLGYRVSVSLLKKKKPKRARR
jgi:hypothetical protein